MVFIQERIYVMYLDECEVMGTHWIASYVNAKNKTQFVSFGVKYVPKKF